MVFFQGHAAPGIYARAYLEGRIDETHLENFRRELKAGGGLSSYPHPWLMPDFWEYPTVSMGLGPIMAIYHSRFIRYMEDRGLMPKSDAKVWAFLGDGETDEPEALGAITLPAREKLDNLIFVINCNLQRLDGPVRGNGQIIQELEATFRGAGWNVIKVIWGREWDPLLAKDRDGLLVKRMGEIVDGQYQKYAVESGAYVRQHFWGADPRLLEMVKHLSDDQLKKLTLGGHDPIKVYNAYKAAVEHKGAPTVILARTVKGYGLGEAGEGKNITHQQKKMNEEELRAFRTRFGIPVSDAEIHEAPFYRPPEEASKSSTCASSARSSADTCPPARSARSRSPRCRPSCSRNSTKAPKAARRRPRWCSCGCCRSSSGTSRSASWWCRSCRTRRGPSAWRRCSVRWGSTRTSARCTSRSTWTCSCITRRRRTARFSKKASPRPDRCRRSSPPARRTRRTASTRFRFSSTTRCSGSSASATSIWAAADARTRGFMLGGTAGRTTLAGEGLQHQDGNSHLFAMAYPNCLAYDPAFAYEIAVIIEDGIRRMYVEQESVFYYLTVMNEQSSMPPMPDGVRDGILKGMYKFRAIGPSERHAPRAALRQRRHPARSDQGSGNSRGEVQRRRRRVEHHELRGAVP